MVFCQSSFSTPNIDQFPPLSWRLSFLEGPPPPISFLNGDGHPNPEWIRIENSAPQRPQSLYIRLKINHLPKSFLGQPRKYSYESQLVYECTDSYLFATTMETNQDSRRRLFEDSGAAHAALLHCPECRSALASNPVPPPSFQWGLILSCGWCQTRWVIWTLCSSNR